MPQNINVRDEVARAIQSQWDSFAQRHPNLAKVVDCELLIEAAAEEVAADPDYQKAMAEAQLAATGAEAVVDAIAHFAIAWLKRLL